MAEGRGEDDSSVDSLSDEESWALYFDLPDNDQTWLWCPPGVDPMSRVDLSEIFTASQRFGRSPSSHSSVNIHPEAAKGEVFDSRTFTRPKKQNPNTVNPGLLQTTSHQNSKLTRTLSQSTSDGEDPFVKTANKLIIRNCVTNETVIRNDSLNAILASLSFRILKKNKSNYNTLSFSEITSLENISHPTSYFINLSDLDCSNDNVDLSKIISMSFESKYQTVLSTPRSNNKKKIKNYKSYSKKASIDSLAESESYYSTPNADSPCLFNPAAGSTPTAVRPTKISSLNITQTFIGYSKKNRLNYIFDLSRNSEIAGDDIHGADNLNDSVIANSPQITLKEEEVIIKSDNINIPSHKEYNLTPRILRKLNETFTSKNDSNLCKKKDLPEGNKLNETFTSKNDSNLCKKKDLSEGNHQALENTSFPSGFLSNLSLNSIDLTPDNNDISIVCSGRMNETIDIKNPKSLIDNTFVKEVSSVDKIHFEPHSPEKYFQKNVDFLFNSPGMASTPKIQVSTNIIGKANVDVQTLKNVNCANNNIITNLNEQCKSSNMNIKSVLNNNLIDNAVCFNEPVVDNIIPNYSDKNNSNYLLDKECCLSKAPSVENLNKNLKVHKDKDEDSAPDSCYSSSSNIRSTGDVCGIIQQHENFTYQPSMRKSVSHDSLLSQETYKTNSSQFKKHGSELTLIPVASVKGKKRVEKVIPDSKYLGAMSKIARGRRTLQKPTFSIRNSDFENINPNETFCVDELAEKKVPRPSMLKAPTEFSKIPIPQKSGIPVFQNRRQIYYQIGEFKSTLAKLSLTWVHAKKIVRKVTPLELATVSGRTHNITDKLCNEISCLFNSLMEIAAVPSNLSAL